MAGDRPRLFVAWKVKKPYVSYLNNEISLCDFEYVVVTYIWWPLTARDCFCYKKWSAKPFNVIKQFFFWLSISPHTCFFSIVRKICNIFLECLPCKLAHKNIWLHRTSDHSTTKRISRKLKLHKHVFLLLIFSGKYCGHRTWHIWVNTRFWLRGQRLFIT